VELSYSNGWPLPGGEGEYVIPTYLKPLSLGDKRYAAMQLAWREMIPGTKGGQITGLAALGTMPPASPALVFNFTGLLPVEATAGIGEIKVALETLHTHIHNVYDSTIAAPEA
jgi:hypothetical protein